MDGHPLSLGYSLGIWQGEEYRDVPATSSPGHPACCGPSVPSPLFLLEQELFGAVTTAFMQHITLPRLCRTERESLLHGPSIKVLVFLHLAMGQNCMLSDQNPCLLQTLAGQRPRLPFSKLVS